LTSWLILTADDGRLEARTNDTPLADICLWPG
jgi:hypothetical protein